MKRETAHQRTMWDTYIKKTSRQLFVYRSAHKFDDVNFVLFECDKYVFIKLRDLTNRWDVSVSELTVFNNQHSSFNPNKILFQIEFCYCFWIVPY